MTPSDHFKISPYDWLVDASTHPLSTCPLRVYLFLLRVQCLSATEAKLLPLFTN
ncbi:hypothetical protein K435DRAFT_867412 [Dendrothele bispora CBS 962.96]|uniref:Uncharacterized protein n=1 Tax=Dendrothele bispora (strain CBS 962.96) TaxID=1314807 RepID=A0A4S8LEQ8_DENBC|nr:hypothetical protein K435DRAFT_867412 [Dendrothele bispora CBS 962.96]